MKPFGQAKYERLTNELVAPTPIHFENSLYFNFIIEASMSKLRNICNQWFNIPSNFERVFEPVMPYVMVTYAYYPRAYSEDWKKNSMGFMPYKELIYVMFVKEHKPLSLLEDIGIRKPNFYGFVPFLFLDNPIPVACGREIFGMPKVMADLDYPKPGDTGAGQKFRASTIGFNKTKGKAPLAKEQLIMEIGCPDNFNISEILLKASGNPHEAASKAFYRNAKTDLVDLNLSARMMKIHEMPYIAMRQYRDLIFTDKTAKKSIIEFPGRNLTVTKGGILDGTFKIKYGRNSETYPVQEAMGLANEATLSFWFQWDFVLVNGKNIWEWKGR